jgi:hypothetical protein
MAALLEIRWAPVEHTIIALLKKVPGCYNAAPIAANIGFTFRF